MRRFCYSPLHESLSVEHDRPIAPPHVTPSNVVQSVIEGHLLLTGLLYQRGRLNPDQVAMFQKLSHGCFENYLKPDGSMYEDLDDVDRSKLKTYLTYFLHYWFTVLAPIYEGVVAGLNYKGGAPEVIFYRSFGKLLNNGERFSIQLPGTVSWDMDFACQKVGEFDGLLEIHTALNYPMLIRSSPRHIMLPPRIPEISDQERFGVVLAPSDFRVMRTRSIKWKGKEITVMVVRPIPADSPSTLNK